MDFEHIGRELEVEALGKIWKLSRLDRGMWREWMAWARTQLPDPIEEALKILDRVPADVANTLVQKALEEKTSHLSIGSPKVNALLRSPEGAIYLLYLLLRPRQPDVTEDDAMQIVFTLGVEAMQQRFDEASGLVPEGNVVRPVPGAA